MNAISLLRDTAAIVGFGIIFLGSLSGLPFAAIFATAGIAWTVLLFANPGSRPEPRPDPIQTR